MLEREAQALIEFLKKHIDIEIVNPFCHPYTERWYKQPTRELADKIVLKDLNWINDCDLVIAFYPEYGIGTCMEIWYTHTMERGKPIFVITGNIRGSSTATVPSSRTEPNC